MKVYVVVNTNNYDNLCDYMGVFASLAAAEEYINGQSQDVDYLSIIEEDV